MGATDWHDQLVMKSLLSIGYNYRMKALIHAKNPHVAAIENSDKSQATKYKYRRAVIRALSHGIDLTDPKQLRDYGDTLSSTEASFLRAAVKLWAKDAMFAVNATVEPTAESVMRADAIERRFNALSDAVRYKPQKKGDKAHNWLDADKISELIAAPDATTPTGLRDRSAILLMVAAGLRRGEAITVQCKDIVTSGKRRVLSVTGKGNKHRAVPLSDGVVQAIREWTALFGNDGKILRRFHRGGKIGGVLRETAVYDIVKKHGEAIGVPSLLPHDLRRSYAQLGISNGVPLHQVSLLLGHSNVAVTQRYLNSSLDYDNTISDFVCL